MTGLALQLDHVSLRVPDYTASFNWYTTVLGLPVILEWTDPTLPGLRLCHLQFGQTKLELIGDGAPHPRQEIETVDDHMHPEGVIHLCLTVPDLAAAVADLTAKGVEIFGAPLYVAPLGISLVVVKDNSGNILEISQDGRSPLLSDQPAAAVDDAAVDDAAVDDAAVDDAAAMHSDIVSKLSERDLDALAQRARSLVRPGGRVVLGITGSPGAGKTTLAKALVAKLTADDEPGAVPSAVHLPMDGFHLANASLDRLGLRNRKGSLETFDGWGFVGLLQRVTREIDHTVYAPSFERTLEEPIAGEVPIPAGTPLVVVEGNYLLVDAAPWDQVRPLLTEAWFCDTPAAQRLDRLVERHVVGGRDLDAATDWAQNVDGANAVVIEATRPRADLVVAGDTPL